MRKFLLNLISFHIVYLYVEIDHPLGLTSNQVGSDHRGLVRKNRKFASQDIKDRRDYRMKFRDAACPIIACDNLSFHNLSHEDFPSAE